MPPSGDRDCRCPPAGAKGERTPMVSAVAHYPLSRVLRGLDEYFPLLTPLTFLWPSHRRCLAKIEGEHGFLSVLSFCFMPGNFAAVICRAYQCAASRCRLDNLALRVFWLAAQISQYTAAIIGFSPCRMRRSPCRPYRGRAWRCTRTERAWTGPERLRLRYRCCGLRGTSRPCRRRPDRRGRAGRSAR